MRGLYAVAATTILVVFSLEAVLGHHHTRQGKELPVCPPDDNEIILFPKPENCSEFYQCAGGVAFTHHCPANLYYCAEREYCDYIDNCDYSNCVLEPENATLDHHSVSDGTHVPTAVPECPEQVDGNLTLLANPENCSSYYDCDNGVAVEMDCPKGLYFCSEKDICTWVWDGNCSFDCKVVIKDVPINDLIHVPTAVPECPPQVDGNLTLLANPDNCSSFYECDNGIPVLMDCPPSLYFCSEKDLCTWVWDANCTFDCHIVSSNDVPVNDYIEDTMNSINHGFEVPHTKVKKESVKKSFH